MPSLTAAGAAVYALSYDEPDALADFAAEHGITYRFLSDPNSEVIRKFGILNTLIPADDHPWAGIPFPGAYVTDAEGVIRSKFFQGRLAIRASGDQLLRALLGGPPRVAPEGAHVATVSLEEGGPDAVVVRVWTAGRELPPGIAADLVVQAEWGPDIVSVELDDNDGSIIALDPEGYVSDEGDEVVVPFFHNGSKLDDDRKVLVSGTVRTDQGVTYRFEMRVPSGKIVTPHYPSDEQPLEPGQMDSAKHLAKLKSRREAPSHCTP